MAQQYLVINLSIEVFAGIGGGEERGGGVERRGWREERKERG